MKFVGQFPQIESVRFLAPFEMVPYSPDQTSDQATSWWGYVAWSSYLD
jgi:hypothetical protein